MIAGTPGAADTETLRAVCLHACPVDLMRIEVPAAGPDPATESLFPPTSNKVAVRERATAWVCDADRCRPPVQDPAELAALLH